MDSTSDTAANSVKPLDISDEQYRTYTYANGTFTIRNPVKLYLLEGGASHRVVDRDGVTHRPERGWSGISWKPVPGAPPFTF